MAVVEPILGTVLLHKHDTEYLKLDASNGPVTGPLELSSTINVSHTGGAASNRFGLGTTASGDSSLALGQGATASGTQSVAIGLNSIATVERSFAVGSQANAASRSTAFGYQAVASGTSASALGYATKAEANNTIAIGVSSQASALAGIAIGSFAITAHSGSISIGRTATSTKTGQFVIGGTNGLITEISVFNANPLFQLYDANKLFIIKGAASHAVSLQEWQDSSGNVLASVSSAGKIFTASEIEIDGDLNHDGTNIGFFGVTPTTRQTELTDELTTITHTAPGTPDYAIAAPVDSAGGSAFGFSTADEFNTAMSVIANLQTRVNELETKLTAYGLLQDAD